LKTYDCVRFAEKYRVSLEWLICGDLKGLIESVRACPSRPRQPARTPDELQRAKLQEFSDALKLDEKLLGAALVYVRRLAKA
jgi:hypothetical protein